MQDHTTTRDICKGADITRVFNRSLCSKCLVEIKPLPMVQLDLVEEVKQAELFAYFDEIAESYSK